jgi:hypothetical protein
MLILALATILLLVRSAYCPTQRINNRMPTGINDLRSPSIKTIEQQPTDYYIKDGVRVELDEFPEWMGFACLVPTSIVR